MAEDEVGIGARLVLATSAEREGAGALLDEVEAEGDRADVDGVGLCEVEAASVVRGRAE